MKSLIGLFFIFGTVTTYAQDANKDVIAENKPVIIKVKTTLPEAKKTEPKAEETLSASGLKTDVLNGFSTGKADLLAKYFPANIDINILGKSNLYSKSQAQQVLTTFFTQNKPSGFAVIHEGQSNGTKYFIGTYTTNAIKYRVTVNVKMVGGTEQISSISIER
ncbi:MAG: DUF4783 domain-containing protein [Putridiphycobacter sp.]|nr:DUF4783 domain-containing protein [Putridiphycobacter sp.]